MSTVLNVILVILIIIVAALAVLYFLGRKLEKRQVEQQALMEAAAQTVSMLVIDKKKMKLDEPIKTLGTHIIALKLHKDVTAKLTVKVVEK